MMKVVAIVQARMGSTRLPGKVLMEIRDKPMLEHVIDRLRETKMLDEIVVATTTKEQDKVIIQLAKKLGVSYFAGSENDVLGRYLGAAEEAKADIIVRITADCPLIDPRIIDDIVKHHLRTNANFTYNLIDENNEKSFPRGSDVEVFSNAVLKRIGELAKEPRYREHVTSYVYEHPEPFKIEVIEAEGIFQRPHLRLCVDEEDDLRFISEIYARLFRLGKLIRLDEVIKLLEACPELQQINVAVKQKHESTLPSSK